MAGSRASLRWYVCASLLAALPAGRLTAQVRVTLSLDRTTAAPGDTLHATLVATNTDSVPTSIRWLSGQLYDVAVLGLRGRQLWSSSNGYSFDQAIHPRTLAAGQRLVYTVKVPLPRSAGTYHVVGTLTTQPVRSASVVVTVR